MGNNSWGKQKKGGWWVRIKSEQLSMKNGCNNQQRLTYQLKILKLKLSKIIKDLERINKVKADIRRGNKYYYDESIKPESRCRYNEYPNSC